jgi:HPt (histidine-containing phosphotransfer) domain-containing protein
MSERLLNATTMMEQAGNDIELAHELTNVFLETSDALISDMHNSLLQANWTDLARASHTLKSPLGFFGAGASVILAQNIETQADAGAGSNLRGQIDSLRRDVEQLQQELRQHFSQLDAASE